VSRESRTAVVGTLSGVLVGMPLASTMECRSFDVPSWTALAKTGVAAATSH
jgi:hypothetical protein